MDTPLQYNDLVRRSFANPQHIFIGQEDTDDYQHTCGGDRETGVEFTLFLNKEKTSLKYKFYGSPYALAAAERLCSQFEAHEIMLGDNLNLELLKTELDMPYNYFFILLALEDAWNNLCEIK